jgi:hypothetical protein
MRLRLRLRLSLARNQATSDVVLGGVLGGAVQCSVVCGGSRRSSVVGGLAVRAATSVPRLGVVVVRQVLQASSKFQVLQKQKERWRGDKVGAQNRNRSKGRITRESVSMRAEGEEWAILRRVQRGQRGQSRDGGYARPAPSAPYAPSCTVPLPLSSSVQPVA